MNVKNMTKQEKNYLLPSFLAAFCITILSLTIYRYVFQAQVVTDVLIAEHVEQLSKIFTQINNECGIIDFEHQRNYIDFLNVVSFVGSEIGAMNLKYPKKWKGPYLQDNPTIQEKYYEIVKTNNGYFIVPGQGVVLSNGKTIGKDIIFDELSDIAKMLENNDILVYHGRALAAPVNVGGKVSFGYE